MFLMLTILILSGSYIQLFKDDMENHGDKIVLLVIIMFIISVLMVITG